ncbi:hypothetical protein PRK78_001300 [Emydomyces testavorans]|uniref:Uncharacterized protein n=1 Tax=Emydomyces testavorans TaxID=2070801 RepID=A0AAF0DE38_9EURO|nr:hypothetical protein PRK78_001300 [Emydomyces testavorans]
MSRDENQRLLQLLEEERQLRQEEQRLREQEQERRQEAEERLLAVEKRMRETTLPEYLDACHTLLYLGLTPGSPGKSTKGEPTRPTGKCRPDHIREWLTFPEELKSIWENLMDVDFVTERHFKSLLVLTDKGDDVDKNIRSELDLRHFERDAVGKPVASVIKTLYSSERLRQKFGLRGSITFENHGNTLTDEPDESSEEPARPSRRRSKRRKTSKKDSTSATPKKSPRPLADEFCVYNKGENEKVPAFIVELKPPHKLQLGTIQAGLKDMDLDEIIPYQPQEKPDLQCRRLVAAVITQAFSYMIKAGLEYGYVCTGEAFIFLHVAGDDPTTVFYYLSVPKDEVGETTGFTDELDSENRLHLTAVGQVLAFTLLAIQTAPHCQNWRTASENRLEVWEVEYEVLEDFSSPKVASSPARQSSMAYIRVSPVRTRSKRPPTRAPSCRSPGNLPTTADSSDEDEAGYDPDSPTQRPRRAPRIMVVPPPASSKQSQSTSVTKDKTRQYCTQKCLLGLANGGPLDRACPNLREHGTDQHQIDQPTLVSLLEKQILKEDVRPDTFGGCESLHKHGTRGALFEVILMPYGYTLVGKGFPIEFRRVLEHEKAVYEHLAPIQGVHVPVCLGTMDLRKRPLWYDGIAEIPHFLLLSHAGTAVRYSGIDSKRISQGATESLQAIHRLGVRHCDPHTNNMFWSRENNGVLFIDFERAEIRKERPALGLASPNEKRKRGDIEAKKPTSLVFQKEMQEMLSNTRG